MFLMAREFGAEVLGVGIFVSSAEPKKKALTDYRSLLELSVSRGVPRLVVSGGV
jgi:purine operon repressor